jgi:predicted Zn-dependent peptidase
MKTIPTLMLLTLVAGTALAQDLGAFEKRTTVRKLDNGLTVIITERHEGPVFSYATVVNVGSAQEVPGITGLAHMFEHMAFKGSDLLGTKDYQTEKAALANVEQAYAAYDIERRRVTGRDEAKVKQLEKAWRDAIAEADKYVVNNEFDTVLERAGAVGVNAGTTNDFTIYLFSLPSNRFELWAYAESERFRNPVFREFYKERDVVQEERRMRSESSPIGRLFLQFQATAFAAHPYGWPAIGWSSDLQAFSATDAKAFFDKYYVPANMVIAIVGDINPTEAMPIMEKYFGRLPKKPLPEPLRTVEPPQNAERTVVLHEMAQPIYLEGYHRPANTDPDDPVYSVMSMLMSTGRTSRLYKSMVRDKKIAAEAVGFNNFPGAKYPNLFTFGALPTPGHTALDMAEPIRAEIDRIKTEDVPADELKSVKTRARAGLLRALDSNSGLATQLALAQTYYGDWRALFRNIDRIDQVTSADIKRVASQTFQPNNRTIAYIESSRPAAASTKGGAK